MNKKESQTAKEMTEKKTTKKRTSDSVGSTRKRTSTDKSRSQTKESKKTTKKPDDLSALDIPDIRRPKGTPVAAEILLWMMLGFCVILFLSNIFGIGGMIGNTISRFFFGAFGAMSHLVPFGMFFLAAFLVSNRGNLTAWIKAGAAFFLFLCICAFCELLSGTFDKTRAVADFFETGSQFRTGGGVVGGLFCQILCPIFGSVGAWVFLIVLVLICSILITERSLFDRLKKDSKKVYRRAREDTRERRELHNLKREQVQLQKQKKRKSEIRQLKDENESLHLEVRKPRRDQVISGVTRNTWFDPSLPETEEIHEVTAHMRKTSSHAMQETEPVSMEEPIFTIHRNGEEKRVDEQTFFSAEPFQELEETKVIPVSLEVPSKKEGMLQELEIKEILKEEPKEEQKEEITGTGFEQTTANRRVKNPVSSKAEQEKGIQDITAEISSAEELKKPVYVFPPIDLLKKPDLTNGGSNDREVQETAAKLQQTLHNFGVNVTVTNASCGPSVTRYELMPEQGVKVSRIVNLSDDIKLNLAAADIRIEAPIPGKPAVGIEVPNKENSAVYLRELLEAKEFQKAKSSLSFAVGKDIAGKTVVADIAKMPHLLIAGATGSGKSVCINTLIMSILYKADPEDVKLIMIDPKVVELSVYNGIPHLFIPVVTDPKKASGALNWAVAEMTDRYQKFAESGVRDLKGYNAKILAMTDVPEEERPKKLPQIVIIVDELADLMMVAPGEVEDAICRLAQLARAAGIHLIIATQRPSVNVITGLIKANMPSRIAFSVTSGVDSRTILDMNGAEKLLGKGDMLFYPQGYQKPVRVQGSFVSDEEVGKVTDFLTQKNDENEYQKEMQERLDQVQQAVVQTLGPGSGSGTGNDLDANFVDAGKFIIEKDKASIGMLQRVFKIGFNRAARIMDQLSEAGVVGPEEGTKPRKVLMSMEEFENYVEEFL